MNEYKSLKIYSEIIKNNPILSREEEVELAKIIMNCDSEKERQKAREKLFNSNIRLVIKEASAFKNNYNVLLEDLIQAGHEGLCIAVDRFDPVRFNTKFSTYAISWIKLKIYKVIRSSSYALYVPSNISYNVAKYLNVITDTENMSDSEIMKHLDITQKELDKIRMANSTIIYLDANCNSDDSDNSATIRDLIADPNSEDPSENLCKKQRNNIIKSCINELTNIQKEIITLRYLDDDKQNLHDIGSKYGISGERVRQVEKLALEKLRFKISHKTSFSL